MPRDVMYGHYVPGSRQCIHEGSELGCAMFIQGDCVSDADVHLRPSSGVAAVSSSLRITCQRRQCTNADTHIHASVYVRLHRQTGACKTTCVKASHVRIFWGDGLQVSTKRPIQTDSRTCSRC